MRECGERAVVVKGRASSAERGLLFGRFGTAIVSADGGIGISDLVFPKNDVTFVRNKSNAKTSSSRSRSKPSPVKKRRNAASPSACCVRLFTMLRRLGGRYDIDDEYPERFGNIAEFS